MLLRVAGETVRTMALHPNPPIYPGDQSQQGTLLITVKQPNLTLR